MRTKSDAYVKKFHSYPIVLFSCKSPLLLNQWGSLMLVLCILIFFQHFYVYTLFPLTRKSESLCLFSLFIFLCAKPMSTIYFSNIVMKFPLLIYIPLMKQYDIFPLKIQLLHCNNVKTNLTLGFLKCGIWENYSSNTRKKNNL